MMKLNTFGSEVLSLILIFVGLHKPLESSVSGFQSRSDSFTGAAYALVICMGVHAQRGRGVGVAQSGRYAYHIGAVRDCNRGRGVAQLVRVKIFHAMEFCFIAAVIAASFTSGSNSYNVLPSALYHVPLFL